ncbi:hypothetical protein B0A49_09511 [Cryomyces minteri]|uniref:AB hydrolase-1 domain-containing protein n=1 Tax=Cryomyces minteri TaxID=331657 RepID=A0A4U0WHE6_9PEZI|nr:hypothetical protein B0A49_09511 [Cryomyces minteri]
MSPLRIAYVDCPPSPTEPQRGTIVLLHGFPQTSYQFRHVIAPLADAGYRVIAPDYGGAGASSKPASNSAKSAMAHEIVQLLNTLGIAEPVHVVGHDVGGMITYALASRHPSRIAGVAWGECSLPGTSVYEANRTMQAVQQFHFIFHAVLDLPEVLVAGRERLYINHFFSKIAYNTAAISAADVDHYAHKLRAAGRYAVLENSILDVDIMPGKNKDDLQKQAQEAANKGGAQAKGQVDKAGEAINQAAENLPDEQKEQVQGVAGAASSVVTGVAGTAGGAVKGVLDTAGNTVGALTGGLGSTVAGAAGGVGSTVKTVGGAFTSNKDAKSSGDAAAQKTK